MKTTKTTKKNTLWSVGGSMVFGSHFSGRHRSPMFSNVKAICFQTWESPGSVAKKKVLFVKLDCPPWRESNVNDAGRDLQPLSAKE